jgi:prepilin-type N-terminal cleavage/methylation domain-containing protein
VSRHLLEEFTNTRFNVTLIPESSSGQALTFCLNGEGMWIMYMNTMTIKNRKGFTLVEIMLATVILVISIIPVTIMLPRIYTDNKSIALANRAVFLGQMKMEEVKTKALTFYNSNYSVSSATAFASPDNMFKYKVSDVYDTDIKTLIVTVWYDNNSNNVLDGTEESVQYKTKIANRGE